MTLAVILLCLSLVAAGKLDHTAAGATAAAAAVVGVAIPTAAKAAIPWVMAKTGVVVAGVGTFHGAVTAAVQAVALVPIAPAAVGCAAAAVGAAAAFQNREIVGAAGASVVNAASESLKWWALKAKL